MCRGAGPHVPPEPDGVDEVASSCIFADQCRRVIATVLTYRWERVPVPRPVHIVCHAMHHKRRAAEAAHLVQWIVQVELPFKVFDYRTLPRVPRIADVIQVFSCGRRHSILHHPTPWTGPASKHHRTVCIRPYSTRFSVIDNVHQAL
eukprot:SAG11_NODE_3974_length_2124_cov_1.061637_2_plen_147_part_00